MRNGHGNPALCAAHRIVLEDAARTNGVGHKATEAVADIIDRFARGERISTTDWVSAMASAFEATTSAMRGARQTQGSGTTADALRESMRRAAAAATTARVRPPPPPPPPPRSAPPPQPNRDAQRAQALLRARVTMGFGQHGAITAEMVKKRRRELGRKHHPDMGGSVEKMKQINAAADLLEQSLAHTA